MPAFINLTGERFGRLVVTEAAESARKQRYWLCVCDCGKTKTVKASHLRDGLIRSCGCLRDEGARERAPALHRANTKTGLSGTPTYTSWCAMRSRCSNPNNPKYSYYGGRGIKVCERWTRFEDFVADMGVRPPDLTLDRIDPNGHYEPGNCRWVSRMAQQNNRRGACHRLEYMGTTDTIAGWARAIGISGKTLSERIRRGWPTARALTTKVTTKRS